MIDNVELPQLNIFPRPVTTTNVFTIYNFCSYTLWVDIFIGATNNGSEQILAGGRLDRSLDSAAGVNYKVSKYANINHPVQVEYSANESVFFDLSLIDCLGTDGMTMAGKPIRNGEMSMCAGHEKGLQLGNNKSRSWQCAAGAWCDDQAYLYEVSG